MAIAEWANQIGRRVSEQELMCLPDDGYLYERVDGLVAGKPALTLWENNAAVNLVGLFGPLSRGKGIMTCGKGGFRMTNGNIRVPAVSFTRKARLPGGHAPDGFGDFAPDLCVEIISPSERCDQMTRKVQEYFAGGAVQVWHVFPERQEVVVFTSPTETQRFGADGLLDAGGLLPGFSCRVSDLFIDDWI